MEDQRPCTCCGQMRPCPTQPGEWEYMTHCYLEEIGHGYWQRASVRLPLPNDRDGQDGLRLWVKCEEGKEYDDRYTVNGETMIWWPDNAKWRKVS